MTDERWLPIPGFPHYEVSDQGNVRSLDHIAIRSGPKGNQRRRGVMLKPVIQRGRYGKGTPYRSVTLYGSEGKKPARRIGALVLTAFVGPRPPGLIVRHRNDDSLDDRLENLVWGTYLENAADAITNGKAVHPIGEKHHATKLVEADVLAIRKAASDGQSQYEIAARYGLHQGTVWSIIHRKTWKHV